MTNSRMASLKFLLLWIALVSVGYFIGSNLGGFLTRDFDDRDFALESFLLLALIGLFIGLGQWIAIQSRVKTTWIWIPVTAMGFPFGGFISLLLVSLIMDRELAYLSTYPEVYRWVEMTVTLMATGMFAGALQWLALKRKLKQSIKWVLVSGLSLTVGYEVAYFNAQEYSEYFSFNSIQFGLIFSLIFGLLTGVFAESLIIRHKFRTP